MSFSLNKGKKITNLSPITCHFSFNNKRTLLVSGLFQKLSETTFTIQLNSKLLNFQLIHKQNFSQYLPKYLPPTRILIKKKSFKANSILREICTHQQTMSHSQDFLSSNWKELNDRVNQLSKIYPRAVTSPLILAVSKFQPQELIESGYKLGIRHFGENYVQELLLKASSLPKDIKWHLIGHLQTNKCKILVTQCPNLYMVETIDSEKLAYKLNLALKEVARHDKLKILIQVKTAENEENKTGIKDSKDDVISLTKFIISSCTYLDFSGLMTVGNSEHNKAEDGFEKLVSLKDQILSEIPECFNKFQDQIFELSMGMSGDMDIALSKGSTEIRVGSSLFGARIKKTS